MVRYILLLLFTVAGFALSAQADCNRYFPFKEGQTLKYANYDKKGKLDSHQTSEYTEVKTDGDKVSASIHTIFTSKKGDAMENDFEMECEAGELTIEVTSMVGQDIFAPMEGMEITVTGTPLNIPADLKVGQELADGDMLVTADGPIPMKITVSITDRKIVEKKTITTDAGTFDCILLDQTMEVKMIVKSKSRVVQYISEGIGTVRTESYNANGKLMSYSELVSIEG